MQFITSHWGEIATLLWGTSELLGEVPSIKANSIFGVLKGMLKAILGK